MSPTRLALLGLVAAASSGCFSRYLLSIEDGPAESGARTTILATYDYKNNVLWRTAKWVYWECEEKGGGLVCEQRCDILDDQGEILACQKSTGVF